MKYTRTRCIGERVKPARFAQLLCDLRVSADRGVRRAQYRVAGLLCIDVREFTS